MGQQEPKDQPRHSCVPAVGTPEPLGLPGSGSPRRAPSSFASPQAHHGGFKPAREGGAAREGKGGTGDGAFEEKDFLGPMLLSGPSPVPLGCREQRGNSGTSRSPLAPASFLHRTSCGMGPFTRCLGGLAARASSPPLVQPASSAHCGPTTGPGRCLQTGMGRCACRRHGTQHKEGIRDWRDDAPG